MAKIDFEAIFAEPFDPCAALAALRPAYMKMKLTQQAQKITFRDRDVWLFQADLAQWDATMRDLERQCREKQGLPSGRFAITGGYRQG